MEATRLFSFGCMEPARLREVQAECISALELRSAQAATSCFCGFLGHDAPSFRCTGHRHDCLFGPDSVAPVHVEEA